MGDETSCAQFIVLHIYHVRIHFKVLCIVRRSDAGSSWEVVMRHQPL